MSRFVQLHLLTSYAPANLNRDDLGRPKTAMMGGYRRLRVSSQSLKRAWRTSDVFDDTVRDYLGVRTKELGARVFKRLTDGGAVPEEKARQFASEIAGVFGKLKSDKPLEIEQLVHLGPPELRAVDELAALMAERASGPTEEELDLLRAQPGAVDIALFGRMLAKKPSFNVEAAAQVAHAISVHEVDVEDDFFTAVDDLNEGIEDVGAGHMGETEFAAALLYLYVCIDRELLLDNLDRNESLAESAITALVKAATTVSPTGKQNSFASRARASFVMCEKGNDQPRSLAVAFLEPPRKPYLPSAIDSLVETKERMDRIYGDGDASPAIMNALTGLGSITGVARYAVE